MWKPPQPRPQEPTAARQAVRATVAKTTTSKSVLRPRTAQFAMSIPTPKACNTTNNFAIKSDELGKLIRAAVHCFLQCDSWEDFVVNQRSGIKSDISHVVESLNHPARDFLTHLKRHGAPAPMSTPHWSLDKKNAAITRGPHQSAKQ